MLEKRLLMANEPPTDLVLFPNFLDENQPVGTVVGVFSATDPDLGDTFSYSLVNGNGDADNGLFTIDGDQLKTATRLDHEAKPTCNILVRVTDAAGATLDRAMTIFVDDVNEAPRTLRLSSSTVAENQPAGTVVGVLSASDPDKDDTLAYSLAAGDGGADNGSFKIEGNRLLTAAAFNFEVKAAYSVRVAVTDVAGLSLAEPFVVSVTNANEAPTAIRHTYSAFQNTQLTVGAPGLLQGSQDPENDARTASLVVGKGPGNGIVQLFPDGSFVYQPDRDFVGTDQFQYRVFDGQLFSSPATVTIAVDFGPDPVIQMESPGLVIGENNLVLTVSQDNLLLINFANRQVLFSDAVLGLNSITVRGADGRGDRLTIESSVSRAGVLPGGVAFHGGSGHLADALVLRGSAAADEFSVAQTSATFNLLVVAFSNIEQLILDGGSGNDVYQISALSADTTIADTKGNDWLDFSDAPSGVTIDLGKRSRQTVFPVGGTLTIKGTIENVIGAGFSDWIQGNSANNVLVGGGGDDRLSGGAGRDLLIGGEGSDVLRGGSGDDILIGGTTAYDERYSDLAMIMSEWTSSRPFRKRRDALTSGVLPLVQDQTLFDDAVRDELFGGPGQDWFFNV